MEIKVINDGLRDKNGNALHTYEYSFVRDEVVDVYHLQQGESIRWQSATKEIHCIENLISRERSGYEGPYVTPWVDMEIEAFIICTIENQGKIYLYVSTYMIEVQEIECYPQYRDWIFYVEVDDFWKYDLDAFIYKEVILTVREYLEQEGIIKWEIKDLILARDYENQELLRRDLERDKKDADLYIEKFLHKE